MTQATRGLFNQPGEDNPGDGKDGRDEEERAVAVDDLRDGEEHSGLRGLPAGGAGLVEDLHLCATVWAGAGQRVPPFFTKFA